ncbi:MAG: S9 family peptidase [Vicinamibacterales bacterium]|jgi:dipeptidyl aminopeptidase/acylaminoacyl peptidase|nr:S9 family peptidase [Vicinamibacterales bacterium]HJO38744.1 S9 family peptidase [Vicinamibacterales bacterium]
MRRISIAVLAGAWTLAAWPHVADAQQRGLQPEDYYQEVAVSQTAISPAGDLVAFTAMTIVEDDNARHREIWVQRLRGGAPDGEPFRFTDPTEESSSPQWSPDGRILSFQSRRGDDPNATWFARVTSPGGEAFHVDGVEGAPVWSPDGEWIAYTKAPDPDPDNEASDGDGDGSDARRGWTAPDAISRTLDVERFDGRVVTSMRYKRDGQLQLQPHPSTEQKAQLFVVAAAGGEPTRLTTLEFNVDGVVWSPDAARLYFTGDASEDDEYNRDLTTDIHLIDREGGEPRRLTSNPGAERSLALSADGNFLAYLATPERGAETDLKIVRLNAQGRFSGAARTLTNEWHLAPGAPTWTPEGMVRFSAGIGGSTHLFEVTTQGGLVRQVTSGARRVQGISTSADGQIMAYTVTDADSPTEAFVARGDGMGEQQLTSFNNAWLTDVQLMPAERLSWFVADGSEIEGWVIKPVGYQPGTQYPMVLKIHGGPHGAYGNTFFRTFHVLSNAGFFVLYPNPRGSTGYGHAFTYATRGAWGEMDSEDYLGGVDAALATYPDIDPDRVGVSGGSYGGFMSNWLTATTDRFAASVTSRSITNWESWYGASDAQGLTEYEFLGAPWEERELYRRLSPISYVENVTAPTLIIHSENDYRTPIADGEQWFMALKKQQVPVELVRYPRSSHGLSRSGEPWLLVDRMERLSSWFEHWLIEVPAATRTNQP